MNEFMKILLSLSLSGTLLLLIMLVLKQVYRNRFSKRWQYYIWLVAALRFLIPFTPDNALVDLIFEAAEHVTMETDSIDIADYNVIKTDDTNAVDMQFHQKNDFAVSDSNPLQYPIDLGTCLFFAWAAVLLVFVIRKITIYQSFVRYMKASNQEVSDIRMLNILSDCEDTLHIRQTVELYQNPLIGSPMILGFFHPRIILPVREVQEERLSYIYIHELIHLKRWDIVYKWFIQLVLCIHWFNPFVYLLEREVGKACELSCDEAVIDSLDDSAKKAYGDMLLSFLKTKDAYKNSLASVTLTEGAKQIKERLGAIMNFKKKSKTMKALTVILTILICVCFQTLGVYAGQNKIKQVENKTSYDSVLYDDKDNAYYILCAGADWIDIPSCSFSDGTIGIVLVKKDAYRSLGPFSGTETLVEEVKRQLQYGVGNGYETKEDAEIILKVAKEIQNSTITLSEGMPKKEKEYHYTYTQRGYYQKPFVIEMGWNLSEKEQSPDYSHAEIILEDNSKMTVWFADSAKEYVDNHEALLAISALIQSIYAQEPYSAIEMPVIMKLDFVDDSALADYAEECFEDNDLIGFSAVFSALDRKMQTDYCERVYEKDEIAFFSTIIPYMDRTLITQYADRAYKDERVNFFAVILDYMDDYIDTDYSNDFIDDYAQKAYDEDDIAAFAILTSHMPEEKIAKWLLKAQNDKKFTFCMVLSD